MEDFRAAVDKMSEDAAGTGGFESFSDSEGPADETHDGVSMWTSPLVAEFPDREGKMHGIFLDLDTGYVEVIGPNNRVIGREIEIDAFMRNAMSHLEQTGVILDKKVENSLSLILVRFRNEMNSYGYGR